MGSEREKKEKKIKKVKKEKKEKKKKRQKIDHDEASIDDTTADNDVSKDSNAVGGLPPAFYEMNMEKNEAKEESTPDSNDATEDAPAETATAEGDAAAIAGKKKRKRKRKRKTNDDDENNDENEETATNTLDHVTMVQDTVFVEGIPFDKTSDDVRAFFVDEHGIPDADVLELRLPTWQDTGRLRGFGHIRFASTESYRKALGLNRKYMGRRYLSIQPAKNSSGNRSGKSVEDPNATCPEGCVTIYVNNLPYGASEEDIASAFSKHTPQSSIAEDGVRIARNSVTRQSKGFCYIDFETSKDAQRLMKAAVKKNVFVGGRIVRLDYDTGRIKGSFRTESGRLLNKHPEN